MTPQAIVIKAGQLLWPIQQTTVPRWKLLNALNMAIDECVQAICRQHGKTFTGGHVVTMDSPAVDIILPEKFHEMLVVGTAAWYIKDHWADVDDKVRADIYRHWHKAGGDLLHATKNITFLRRSKDINVWA